MKKKMETLGNGVLGNTKPKPRTVPSKRWCFTYHDYPEEEMETMEIIFKDLKCVYIIGKEHTEDGRPHLQGYVEAPDKIRPVERFKLSSKIHWEKTKGTREENYKYCSKEGNFKTNIKIPRPLIDPLNGKTLHAWQAKIKDILTNTHGDGRTVYWFHEPEGKAGKSSFIKHMCINYNATKLGIGDNKDNKSAIADAITAGREIDMIFFNYPRTNNGHIPLDLFEEILDGHFFSGKYESKDVLFNPPHVVVFANFRPDALTMKGLSVDRWVIEEIKKGEEE